MKSFIYSLLLTFIFINITTPSFGAEDNILNNNSSVYKLKISGIIDNGLAPYIQRGINEAEENNASYIIFEINTFGGRVDAATVIKDAILNSSIPTVAYINKRAISAGALISLSCNKIIMYEGSSIGATTVVDDKGEKQSEKSQSYMRAEMASTAEKNNRRKDIAQAMVDEDIEIKDISLKGKLLTLTSEEALEYGICDKIVSSEKEMYTFLKLEKPLVKIIQVSVSENIVRFLTNPIVSSLLMTLGFLGLIFEVKTAGWGVGGTVGVIALSLFFGSHYIINMADHIELIIFAVGLVFVALEVFVIPGFGFAGVIGILAILASFYLTLLGRYPTGDDMLAAGALLSVSFISTIVGSFIMLKYLPKTNFLNFLVVKQEHKGRKQIHIDNDFTFLENKSGIAITDLRLSGNAEFIVENEKSNKIFQVISKHEYISAGDKIFVEKVEGSRVIVIKSSEE